MKHQVTVTSISLEHPFDLKQDVGLVVCEQFCVTFLVFVLKHSTLDENMALVAPSFGMLTEPSPGVNQPLLQSAGENFDAFLFKDRSYPELSQLLGVTSSGRSSKNIMIFCSVFCSSFHILNFHWMWLYDMHSLLSTVFMGNVWDQISCHYTVRKLAICTQFEYALKYEHSKYEHAHIKFWPATVVFNTRLDISVSKLRNTLKRKHRTLSVPVLRINLSF